MSEHASKTKWVCLRCLWILGGREGEEIPDHSTECPFRNTGEDPEQADLHVGSQGD